MEYQDSKLLINLSMLVKKPTGITNYIEQILPYLNQFNSINLVAENSQLNNNKSYTISEKLSPDHGSKGHFNRLIWTQFQLPNIYQQLKSNLLFSPVPEAPLYSKTRSIIMVHDLIPIRFPKKKSPLTPYFRYYIPEVCKQAQHIICNSQATADDIINYFGISAQKITPIHLSYNSDKFKLINNSNKVNKTPYFLYLGRHDPHKNVAKIITAFSNVYKGQKNCELWLVGPSDLRYTPILKNQTIELEIEQKVKFFDYVSLEELPLIMANATALVFTTLWEGFGFPVLEAMACGLPVITSNVSSLPEVAGDAAILVNPAKVEEITEAMKLIINDSKLREKMGNLGLERVKQFSWQKTGEMTAEIINKYL